MITDKKTGIDLTEQQRRFCKHYAKCLNGTEAYMKAYDVSTDDVAAASASRMLSNVKIIEYLEYLKTNIEEALDLSKLKVVQEHQRMAFSSIANLHNTWITRKEFDLLSEDEKACIQEISTKTQKLYANGSEIGEEVYVKIKLYDKQKSLESISKMLGYDSPTKVQFMGGVPVIEFGDEDKPEV